MLDVAGAATSFKDHFSACAGHYARHRPGYPRAMFDYLANLCVRRDRAWDCATGNGQAATELAGLFRRVIATDASSEQIHSAVPDDRIDYRVAPAESSGLPAGTIDLVTVGQALHWFDRDAFYREVRRVLVDQGVLAAWCYGRCRVTSECDAIVDELYAGLLEDFWTPERDMVERGYRDYELPGTRLSSPGFEMQIEWTVGDMLGYLRTWSACRRFESLVGRDPVDEIEAALRAAWGGAARTVIWPVTILISRL